jgi:hypothetical protein
MDVTRSGGRGVVIIGFQGTGFALIQGRQKAIQIVDIERWGQ